MKKKIYITLLAIVMVSTIAFVTLKKDNTVLESKSNLKINDSRMISMLLETQYESGEYKEYDGNSWPDGYRLNKTLSKCENGSRLEFDEENNKILLKAKILIVVMYILIIRRQILW